MISRAVVVLIKGEDREAVEHVEQEIMDAVWNLLNQGGIDPLLDDDGENTGAVHHNGCVVRIE